MDRWFSLGSLTRMDKPLPLAGIIISARKDRIPAKELSSILMFENAPRRAFEFHYALVEYLPGDVHGGCSAKANRNSGWILSSAAFICSLLAKVRIPLPFLFQGAPCCPKAEKVIGLLCLRSHRPKPPTCTVRFSARMRNDGFLVGWRLSPPDYCYHSSSLEIGLFVPHRRQNADRFWRSAGRGPN